MSHQLTILSVIPHSESSVKKDTLIATQAVKTHLLNACAHYDSITNEMGISSNRSCFLPLLLLHPSPPTSSRL